VDGRSPGLIAGIVTEFAFKMRGKLQESSVLELQVYRLGFEPEQAFGLNQPAYFSVIMTATRYTNLSESCNHCVH
jgi:hypothetical protein